MEISSARVPDGNVPRPYAAEMKSPGVAFCVDCRHYEVGLAGALRREAEEVISSLSAWRRNVNNGGAASVMAKG